MNNLLRTLVYEQQVSLTVANVTDVVREAVKLHNLSRAATVVLGKILCAMTFMGACLKMDTGEISLSVSGDGTGGAIGVSGNKKLHLRGFIENVNAVGEERDVFGKTGSLTIIRDDGYNRPFVGSCAFPQAGGVDEAFEEYFRISEQLPTYLKTDVRFDENGAVAFAGVAVLQPLPFADENTLQATKAFDLTALLKEVREQNVERATQNYFPAINEAWELRKAQYQCNCSKAYISQVLVALGKEQMEHIIKEDGVLRVHCHYCNTNYEFTQEDANQIFVEKKEEYEK